MNLNFLKTFVSVVENGNFSRAASRLHLSQPAVSMQMHSLAQDMGVELFRRHGHRLEPTEAGAILYQRAKEILGSWQGTIHQIDSLRQRLQGRLELGASTLPGDFLLPPFLCDFYKHHPQIEVYMTVASSGDILQGLAQGEFDLAVVGLEPEGIDVDSQVLFQDELVAVFAPGHSVAGGKPLSLEDILAQPLLRRTGGSATRRVLEEAMANLGFGPDAMTIVMELGSTRALLEAAVRGLGVAVVSRLAAADYIEQGRLSWSQISGLNLQRKFWLVQARRPRSPIQEAFVKYMQRSESRG